MKYTLAKSIKRKGYPTSSKYYGEAHDEADNAEKKRYPKGYEKMKVVDKKLKKNELSGTHSKSDKIIVSQKVPKKLRKEVAYHEEVEYKANNRLKRKK